MGGGYITKRWLVEAAGQICREQGIELSGLSDDWLLSLTKDGHTKHIIGYKFSLNDSAAATIAQDKVATHLLLKARGVASVPHMLVRTKASTEHAWETQGWKQFVVKPLMDASGRGVKLFSDTVAAKDWMEKSGIEAWAVSPYVDIERETRLIILDGQPLLAYDKIPARTNGLAMFNLGRGAASQNIMPDDELLSMARRSVAVLGLRVAAVDIITTKGSDRAVLEINDGIMMENYARTSAENARLALEVHRRIIKRMMA